MKNPLKRVWRSFSRWRHGRGFGIHSPLAYDVLTSTLRGQRHTGYYGYRDLPPSQGGKSRKAERRARLVFRLVARFQPRSVAVAGMTADVRYWTSVVNTASRSARVAAWGKTADPDMVIIGRPTPSLTIDGNTDRIDVYLDRTDLARLTDPLIERALTSPPLSVHDRRGPLIIDNGRNLAVCIARRGLSPQHITARF